MPRPVTHPLLLLLLLRPALPCFSICCRFAEVKYLPPSYCPADYDDMVCGGGTGENTCNGDSGARRSRRPGALPPARGWHNGVWARPLASLSLHAPQQICGECFTGCPPLCCAVAPQAAPCWSGMQPLVSPPWLASRPTAPTASLAPTTHTAITQVRPLLWQLLLLLLSHSTAPMGRWSEGCPAGQNLLLCCAVLCWGAVQCSAVLLDGSCCAVPGPSCFPAFMLPALHARSLSLEICHPATDVAPGSAACLCPRLPLAAMQTCGSMGMPSPAGLRGSRSCGPLPRPPPTAVLPTLPAVAAPPGATKPMQAPLVAMTAC